MIADSRIKVSDMSEDFQRNTTYFEKFMKMHDKIPYVNLRPCNSEAGKLAYIMVSFQPPRDYPIGNFAAPVLLDQYHADFVNEINGLLNIYRRMSNDVIKKLNTYEFQSEDMGPVPTDLFANLTPPD
jgi:hypothetical protein